MIAYAVILLLTALLFAVVAVLLFKGKTGLIHDYHQTGVKDKRAYGKAFGKAMGMMAGAMALSGVIALFGEVALWGAIAVLVIGLVIGIFAMVRVQEKYNGGVF